MIVFAACGGLGNQLFQYATARSLATRVKTELVVDTAWFGRRLRNTTMRPYELHRYPISARFPTPGEEQALQWMRGRYWSRISFLHRWHLVHESAPGFDLLASNPPDNLYLNGYWQNPNYFIDIRSILISEFNPREPMSDKDAEVAAEIERSNSICVHVRRGDYVSLPAASRAHGTCSLEYYRAAFEHVRARVLDPVAFVFSDDQEWALANLRFDVPTVHVSHNGPDAAFQDLRLMTLCRHNIIANSSLSWWGAWLGVTADKIVCAPRKWFLDRQPNPDLLPPSWVGV